MGDNGGDGLKPIDVTILQFLVDPPLVQSPSCIARNVDYVNDYVQSRCRVLLDHGLLEQVDRGYYRATERGARIARDPDDSADSA